MCRTLITLTLLLAVIFSPRARAVEWSAWEWTMGLALEGRIQSEVNPQYYGTKPIVGLFARARQAPWSGLLEWNQEGHRSSSGNYSVEARSQALGLWARYEPWSEGAWRPFVGAGAGAFFDRVETTLASSSRMERGRRLFAGASVGLLRTFVERAVVELEARAASIEQGRDPALSGWIRLGFSL